MLNKYNQSSIAKTNYLKFKASTISVRKNNANTSQVLT